MGERASLSPQRRLLCRFPAPFVFPRRGALHGLCTLRKADCLLELVALQLARRYWVARYAEAFHLMRPEELSPAKGNTTDGPPARQCRCRHDG